MERESFEDPEIAALMNEHFVCIKVDREERPDVDAICMEACQAMTGQGGWPLNAFLTPEQAPFYVGTYFPPESRQGMPSWRAVLEAVAAAWDRAPRRRPQVERAGARSRSAPAPGCGPPTSRSPSSCSTRRSTACAARTTPRNGGFGGAPKFPMASVIEFLLVRGEREMSLQTLRAMARGGIYDQVGGGFSPLRGRRHLDRAPLREDALRQRAAGPGLPARLAGVGRAAAARVCRETLDWALREMRGPEGGFCCGARRRLRGRRGQVLRVDGAELRDALGDRATTRSPTSGRASSSIGQMLEARGPEPERAAGDPLQALRRCARERVRPGLDDKRLTSWNALMISALAEAGAALGHEPYLDAATRVRRVPARAAARRRRAAAADRRRSPGCSRTTPTSSRR